MMNSSTTEVAVAGAAAAIERAADGATEQIVVLQAQVAVRDAELERLQDVCDDRQRVIDELSGHVSTYRRAAEERAALVASLDFELQRLRDDLLTAERARNEAVAKAETAVNLLDDERQRTRLTARQREAELRAAQHEIAVRDAELCAAQREVAVRDAELKRLHDVCDDQQRVIDELGGHVSTYRHAAEERAVLLATLDFELQRVRDDLLAAERARNDAVAKADTAVNVLDDERQRTQLTSAQREAELRAAQRETELLRARADVLEHALAARAAVIDELHAACAERLEMIERLSAESASLRIVAEERLSVIESNEAKYRAQETLRNGAAAAAEDGVDWRAIAQERERALHEIAAEAERRSVLLAEVTSALEGRTREAEELRKRLTRAS
jgi:chromosome segregation ATPase